MTTPIGQTIVKVVSLRDTGNVAILGLTEDDFATLEAYLISTPATTEPVSVNEVDDGQYALSFIPTESGPWALHHVYDDPPIFHEEISVYEVATTAEITVITAGGVWTYSGDLSDPLQETRFIIQDTDGDRPLFTDAEIAYALDAAGGSTRRAAASLVEQLMARYAAMADTTELDLSVKASQLFEHYQALHGELISLFGGGGSTIPYAGGISHADIAGNRANTDRVRGIFDRTNLTNRADWGGIRH